MENTHSSSGHPPHDESGTIDPVTGLGNERLFLRLLTEEFFRARERETNGAVLLIKIDDIMGINARHGRRGGDEALRSLGNLLKKTGAAPENSSHLIFRLSGPVCSYVMPDCSADRANSMAREIASGTFHSDLFIERLTVSIGVVNLYEFFLSEEDETRLIRSIEQAALRRLETAERSGGNTVCFNSALTDTGTGDAPSVLIVDPDQSAVEPLVFALEAANLDVTTCRNGEEAYALIRAKPPSAVVCEAMTPRLNGFMLRDRLRANAFLGTIPFILLSHKKTEEFIRKAIDLDIRHYFRKPISITEVAGLIGNLLRGFHA